MYLYGRACGQKLNWQCDLGDIGVFVCTVGWRPLHECIAFVIQFLFMDLDYDRTERVQFEDDDYYYYVKAVPKKMVAVREVTVKHFGNTASMGKRIDHSSRPYEREIQIRDFVLVQRDIKLEEAGMLKRRIMLLSDVSELRKKEREIKIKSAVIQEIHHRVKNNLQTIASLLRLQARRSKVPEVKSALQESTNRILSMSVVHEFLSQQDAEEIRVMEVTRNILNTVAPNMIAGDFQLEQSFDGPEVILPSRTASNLAVIINELILNSIEHGFEGRQQGLIGLHTEESADGYVLELYDNGCGLPPDFDLEKTRSLGLQIIRTLVRDDMGGEIELYNQQGTRARISIPKNPEGGEY